MWVHRTTVFLPGKATISGTDAVEGCFLWFHHLWSFITVLKHCSGLRKLYNTVQYYKASSANKTGLLFEAKSNHVILVILIMYRLVHLYNWISPLWIIHKLTREALRGEMLSRPYSSQAGTTWCWRKVVGCSSQFCEEPGPQ